MSELQGEPHKHPEPASGRPEEELVRFMLQQGELYLDGQLRLVVATQARALSFAGTFTGIATASAGASLGYLERVGQAPLVWAGVAVAVFMLIGALCCLHAAVVRSQLALPGGEPERLQRAAAQMSVLDFLRWQAENYQLGLDRNDRTITRYVRWLRIGAYTGALAPAVGAVTWLYLSPQVWLYLNRLGC